MTTSLVFQICNTIVLPAWLILILFSRKKWRNPVIYGFCAALALVYSIYVFTGLGSFDPSSFSSLAGVKALFTTDEAVLAGWIHYLAFDLLIGNWVVNQAIKYHIKHAVIIPVLFFCFMFGPIGYLLFTIVKTFKNGSIA